MFIVIGLLYFGVLNSIVMPWSLPWRPYWGIFFFEFNGMVFA